MTETDVFAPPPAAVAQGGSPSGPMGLHECRCLDCARVPGKGVCPNARLREVSSEYLAAWRRAQGKLPPPPSRWLYPLGEIHYCRSFVRPGKEADR